MSSNTKEISTKAQKIAEGTKEAEFSSKGIRDEVIRKQKEDLPDFLNYKKDYMTNPKVVGQEIQIRDENKMILNGTIKTQSGGDELIPFGFKQPTKAGKGA